MVRCRAESTKPEASFTALNTQPAILSINWRLADTTMKTILNSGIICSILRISAPRRKTLIVAFRIK
ncbi:MAG: hypothetical protein MK102_09465 [Fuerstiella sp.]|nr:hypothetical protein [Fuerstiella sp.]